MSEAKGAWASRLTQGVLVGVVLCALAYGGAGVEGSALFQVARAGLGISAVLFLVGAVGMVVARARD